MRPGRLGLVCFPAAAAAALALAPPASAAPRVFTIEIKAMKFSPAPAGMHVGDQVVVANHDLFRHTATAVNGGFDLDLEPGKSGRIRLTRAGPLPFFCKFHPGMKGVLAIGR